MDISVGDKVQLLDGSIDISTGIAIKTGQLYSVGSSAWATVNLIIDDFKTGSKYGSDPVITKVQLTDGDMVVWQGDINAISPNVIHASNQSLVQTVPSDIPQILEQTDEGIADLSANISGTEDVNLTNVDDTYILTHENGSWVQYPRDENSIVTPVVVSLSQPIATTKEIDSISSMNINSNTGYTRISSLTKSTDTNTERLRPFDKLDEDDPIYVQNNSTIKSNPYKLRELLGNNYETIQNSQNFPRMVNPGSTTTMLAAKYDYQIIPGKNAFYSSSTLEERLKDARKEFGIHVHGNNSMARLIKYYMYNRYKSPDINLAFNKATTHVFFTRPDLNILSCNNGKVNGANSQTLHHSESSMIYQRYPELFKLLTDRVRCGDDNNFNMLLSNQVESFDIPDETINTVDIGKSWNEYAISYGDAYTGRAAGDFSCTFRETSDLSILNLLKLWISYIDNVGRGAWSPSYNLNGDGVSTKINDSHVYSRTLDYAASVYVFKCGPDGEDILYWSKYYGVFPTNTGSSSLSWNIGDSITDVPKPSIKFKYSFKRDMSPITLLEFNKIANIDRSVKSVPAYSLATNECYQPFVGKPFIEFKTANPTFKQGSLNYSQGLSQIRLKFAPFEYGPTDNQLYKYSMSK